MAIYTARYRRNLSHGSRVSDTYGLLVNSAMICSSGKIPHQTYEAAEAHARSIQQKDGHLPNIYTCQECGFLHIGGGRKSDRPVYFQPSKVPVLPPEKLPRKPYERRKISPGVSWELKDVVIEFILAHHNATDRDVARKFEISHSQANSIRNEAKIEPYLKRQEQKILAELKANPSVHRSVLAKICEVSYTTLARVIQRHGFAGTGLHARPGPLHPLFGKRFSKERKAECKAAAQKRWDMASPEVRAKNAEHCRSLGDASHFAKWKERNPERAKAVARASGEKNHKLYPDRWKMMMTPAAMAKRTATYKAKMAKKIELITTLVKQGMFVVDICKEVHCGLGLVSEVRKSLGIAPHTRARQRTPEEREAFSIKCRNARSVGGLPAPADQ